MTSGGKLGRGLAALIGEMAVTASEANERGSTRAIPIELLEPSSFQPRRGMDEAVLDELAASIRARGLLQPLLVRPHPALPDRFEIVAGERRWRAAQKIGLTEVPALVRQLSLEDAMAAALVENLQRQDLNAIEEAEGYRRLQDEFGLTQELLADAVGKSRSHVANTVRLLKLPSTVQTHVREGALSAGHARALLSHAEPEKAALAVISRGLNVRQTEQLTNHLSGANSSRPRRQSEDPDQRALEQSLIEHLGIKAVLRSSGSRGVLSLHYDSAEQLEGLIALLTR